MESRTLCAVELGCMLNLTSNIRSTNIRIFGKMSHSTVAYIHWCNVWFLNLLIDKYRSVLRLFQLNPALSIVEVTVDLFPMN